MAEPIYITGDNESGEMTIRWPNVLLTVGRDGACYAILKGTTWYPGEWNCDTDARHAADEISVALKTSKQT